jgi:hypothetical protein
MLQVALLPSSLQTPGGFAKPYSLALVRQASFPSLVSSHISYLEDRDAFAIVFRSMTPNSCRILSLNPSS